MTQTAEHVLVFLCHVAVIFTWSLLAILAVSPIDFLFLEHCTSLLFYSGRDEGCFAAAFFFFYCIASFSVA